MLRRANLLTLCFYVCVWTAFVFGFCLRKQKTTLHLVVNKKKKKKKKKR